MSALCFKEDEKSNGKLVSNMNTFNQKTINWTKEQKSSIIVCWPVIVISECVCVNMCVAVFCVVLKHFLFFPAFAWITLAKEFFLWDISLWIEKQTYCV